MNKFDFAISNPPYQEKVSKDNSYSRPIWQKFIQQSEKIALKATFINPARWINCSKKHNLSNTRDKFLNENHLKSLIIYPDSLLFPNISAGKISIEIFDFTSNITEINTYNYIEGKYHQTVLKTDLDIILTQKDHEIVKLILNFWRGKYIEENIKLNPPIKMKNKNKFNNAAIDSNRVIESEDKNNSYKIHFYKKNTLTSAYMETKHFIIPSDKYNFFETYKLLIPRTHAEIYYRKMPLVAKPNEIFTRSFLYYEFKTYKEAINYDSYAKTYLYRYLTCLRLTSHTNYSHVYRWVPDLANTTNPRTQKIGYNSDWTNEDLKRIFPFLNESQWNHIVESASAADKIKKQ